MTVGIRKELFRKSIHLCSALVPTFLGMAYFPVIACLACSAAVYTVSELLRMKGINVPVVAQVTERAARERDKNKFVAGPVTLVLGIMLSAVFFEPEAARVGIYALSFGDGLASLAGKLFGRTRIPRTHGKTVVGSIACFLAVLISSFAVLRNFWQAFALALVAMLIEVLPLADFDNLVIPVVISAAAQFAVNHLG